MLYSSRVSIQDFIAQGRHDRPSITVAKADTRAAASCFAQVLAKDGVARSGDWGS